ncbi:MAG: ABC transporter [Firmicutes bacterium HGW-Firmicutes-15]|nr:MAG: ABC transporter [Firmicutes bacterium HGW-Firmicutes-15]
MNYNNDNRPPSGWNRITSVWHRHERVYNSNFISNAFPPLLEPLIILAGLGIGLGSYIQTMGTMSYTLFLASGIIVTSSMYTAAFECTYGTFIRLEFDHVYDGMLGAPISPTNLILGEILFAGTKGFIFALAVLIITWLTGIIDYPLSIIAAFIGFICGIMFGTLSMWITSCVKNINHFNFYFTGLLSPMFFFSGSVFPIENLPPAMQWVAEATPLTHVVRLARAFCVADQLGWYLMTDLLYCGIFILITGWLAVRGLKKRLVD